MAFLIETSNNGSRYWWGGGGWTSKLFQAVPYQSKAHADEVLSSILSVFLGDKARVVNMDREMTPEDIVRRFTYDPTGTDPDPDPFPHQQPKQWKRSVLWIAAAIGFVGLVLLVTGKWNG